MYILDNVLYLTIEKSINIIVSDEESNKNKRLNTNLIEMIITRKNNMTDSQMKWLIRNMRFSLKTKKNIGYFDYIVFIDDNGNFLS